MRLKTLDQNSGDYLHVKRVRALRFENHVKLTEVPTVLYEVRYCSFKTLLSGKWLYTKVNEPIDVAGAANVGIVGK